MSLNASQAEAIELTMSGSNIFLTGGAGVGKSFTAKRILSSLKTKHREDEIGVTGTTGVAALQINGVTLHSWAGVGLGTGSVDSLVKKIKRSKNSAIRWKKCKFLLIDEVSMLDADFFEKLGEVAKQVRGKMMPFGGIRLILVGDFFQLPPVDGEYCFNTDLWKELNIKTHVLTEVFRQNDAKFVKILNEVRVGQLTNEAISLLSVCDLAQKPLDHFKDDIIPTQLFCKNFDVDAVNEKHLLLINEDEKIFNSIDKITAGTPDSICENFKKAMDKKASPVMKLKKNAQVMLTKNIPEINLVNGSRGIIIGFSDDDEAPIVKFGNGAVLPIGKTEYEEVFNISRMTRKQHPLKLSWATTVHKSQGCSLDRVVVKIDNSFEFGQAYVALSRATSLDGLWINGKVLKNHVLVDEKVLSFYGVP